MPNQDKKNFITGDTFSVKPIDLDQEEFIDLDQEEPKTETVQGNGYTNSSIESEN